MNVNIGDEIANHPLLRYNELLRTYIKCTAARPAPRHIRKLSEVFPLAAVKVAIAKSIHEPRYVKAENSVIK